VTTTPEVPELEPTTPPEPGRVRRQRKAAGSAADDDAPIDRGGLPEEALSVDVQPWLADPWMRTWLLTEPLLGEVDLRPYFYIAHDRVGALAGGELRLSPTAARVLNQLLATGAATQGLGLRQTATLSTADAAALFENLAQRVRQAETLERSPHDVLFQVMEYRPELIPQLIALLGSLPDTKLALKTPVLLMALTRGTANEPAARALLARWSRASVGMIARAATQALDHSAGSLTAVPAKR